MKKIFKPFKKTSVTAHANAKINLTLGVLGKREDGYHLVDTIMQSVSLFDTVTVAESEKLVVKFGNKTIDSEDSISYKAALLFFEDTKISKGAKIHIKNRIPTGSGMGGGSADAAAVLLSLDRLYKTQLPTEKLEEIGLKLGADVPFFIRGGAMRAEGIGEKLTPLTPLKKGYFVLAKADSKPSTAQMYALIDSEQPPLPETELAVKALSEENTTLLSSLFVNSFTSVWKDSPLKKRLLDFEPDGVSLSGSGPTWFAYFTEKKKALKAYKALKREKIECFISEPKSIAINFE